MILALVKDKEDSPPHFTGSVLDIFVHSFVNNS